MRTERKSIKRGEKEKEKNLRCIRAMRIRGKCKKKKKNRDLDMFLTGFMRCTQNVIIERCKCNFEPHVKVLCKAKISISLNECVSTITVTDGEKAVVEAHRECKDERLVK